jgi:cbb3-type cytochrome oxidase maturation protein
MDIIYLLIGVSLILLGVIIGIFMWAIKSGQFDDLEGPAHAIIMDEDHAAPPEKTPTEAHKD